MTKLSTCFTAALAAIACAGAAAPAAAAGSRFACDTPAGRISEFRIPVEATRFAVTGTIRAAELRMDEKWLPTAVIALKDRTGANRLSISAVAPKGETNNAMVAVRQVSGDDDKSSEVGTLAVGNTVGFAITYNQNGQSELAIGDQRFTARGNLGAAFDLSISCSTSDFVFENLSWQIGS